MPLTVFMLARWILRLFLIVVIADLIVGFVHWLEDRYGKETWPLIGPAIIAPNLLHHAQPRAFLVNSWWRSADLQLLAAALICAVAYGLGVLRWELVAILVLVVNANEVHKWTHRTKAENGWFITWLQDWRLIQGRKQHARHHGGNRDSHYCTLTEFVNPALERIRFWRVLEWIITRFTGVEPRIDPVVLARRAA